MNNLRLDFLKRKNKGVLLQRNFISALEKGGIPYQEKNVVELSASDTIYAKINSVFAKVENQFEIIPKSSVFSESKILTSVFEAISELEFAYVYTDEVLFCGMYLEKMKPIIQACLKVAEKSVHGTCFIANLNIGLSLTINYYDDEHIDFKNSFEIQCRSTGIVEVKK